MASTSIDARNILASTAPRLEFTVQHEPRVTIVIATYNRAAILRHTLRSLQLQTFDDWEAWIVGDGCTDDSEAVVALFNDPRMHWTNLPTNSGSQATPNNEGIRRARGKYIAYIGHDDLWLPWHLEGLVQCIEEHAADMAHALIASLGTKGAKWATGALWEGDTYETASVAPSSWLHRKELAEKYGGWIDPAKLSISLDREFLRRMYRNGAKIVGHTQLSVLKFPSPAFAMYTLTADFPQTKYLQALETDPQALHDRLLLELASQYAGYINKYIGTREAVRFAFSRLYYDASVRYAGRWPFSHFFHWHYQRRRQQIRRKRGLPT